MYLLFYLSVSFHQSACLSVYHHHHHHYSLTLTPRPPSLPPPLPQLEEISKFLMPGQYNNMIWFYQECEEKEKSEDKTIQEEEEDVDAKVFIKGTREAPQGFT